MGSGTGGGGGGGTTVTLNNVTISRECAETLWIALGNALRGTGPAKKAGAAAEGKKGPVVKGGGPPTRRGR